jgi:hypothetical protein
MKEEIMTPAAAGLAAHDDVQARSDGTAEQVRLDVIRIEEDGWRVSITGADAGNPFGLLGFITLVDGRYQVCVIGKPGECVQFDTLDAAIDALRPAPSEVDAILAGERH